MPWNSTRRYAERTFLCLSLLWKKAVTETLGPRRRKWPFASGPFSNTTSMTDLWRCHLHRFTGERWVERKAHQRGTRVRIDDQPSRWKVAAISGGGSAWAERTARRQR